MKVLVACEFSGTVRDAFIKAGHDAWSCDIIETEKPGPHYKEDALKAIKRKKWDLLIAHPPCTFLSNAGGHYLKNNPERMKQMKRAARFFNQLLTADIERIVIENPVQHGPARALIRKYDQIIQPHYFGEPEKKTICLWVKGLPLLQPTRHIEVRPRKTYQKTNGRPYNVYFHNGKNSKERARFFQSIAKAMAQQWA